MLSEKEVDKSMSALTGRFNGIKNRAAPVIVERIVSDIVSTVKIVCFDDWENTAAGK